jgi:3-oxoacyl-[acyl-carrier-protein] synthase-1/3-oxoacyl-[acyl-carrier-protein] synthase II
VIETAVVAFGAVSALGEGAAAIDPGAPGALPRSAIRRDDELSRAGLAHPFAARAAIEAAGDRITRMLEKALSACASELDGLRPAWRSERVGLVLGTSSGGMREAEHAFQAIAAGQSVRDVEATTYFGPMNRAARKLGLPLDPCVLVLCACASATVSMGLGARWLERGDCDLVLVGGFDEVTVFVAAGFDVLRAVTARPPPRPFRIGRDGMALGEGAAVLALSRWTGGRARGFLRGFGMASDALHLTAPDPQGRGLGRAIRRALAEAEHPVIDLVSAHGTATPLNDAAEFEGLSSAFGARVADFVVHPFKAQVGHALGAGGGLEVLASLNAIERAVMPASAGAGVLDPKTPVRLLDRSAPGTPHCALKVSAAFGGANAALVVGDRPIGRTGARRPCFVQPAVHVACEPEFEKIAAAVGWSVDRVARGDGLVRMTLAATAEVQRRHGSLAGAGIVVGTAMATIETNAVFAARLREHGARAAEPRRFPYTSPNAAAGECSIAFGLTGPAFAVGGGLHAGLEALACAALLVESGDADAIVVVAADDVGPITHHLVGDALGSGAVGCLLTAAPTAFSFARVGRISLRRGEPVTQLGQDGHRSLLPLVGGFGVRELTSASPPDFLARIELQPL